MFIGTSSFLVILLCATNYVATHAPLVPTIPTVVPSTSTSTELQSTVGAVPSF